MSKGARGKREVTWGQHEVALTDIVRDAVYQVRTRTDPATVARYVAAMRAEQTFPPLRVGIVGGAWVLLDGWHRMAAMEEAGIMRATVEAAEMTEGEARWEAAAANMQHGLPLKRSEMRKVFRVFVRTGQHKRRGCFLSLRELAKTVGISRPTARAWMERDFPKTLEAMAERDGGGAGGSQPMASPESRRNTAAHRAVREAAAHARGIRNPMRRGELVRALEEALAEIKQEAPWEIPGAHGF